MKFLFDASSLFQVIKSVSEDGALRVLDENCILELTKYEVGNALWKEYVSHHTIGEDEQLMKGASGYVRTATSKKVLA